MLPLALCGCPDSEQLALPPATAAATHTVSFAGFAYDGAAGSRIAAYELNAEVGVEITAGEIDGTGRYTLGDLSPWDDYTIIIAADGYRPFFSHNANIGLPPELNGSDDIAEISSHQTLHFDAYLFPAALEAPAVVLTIETPIVGESVSGKIRLRPISPSALNDELAETPGGVPNQVWFNDEDLQTQSLNVAFADSGASFAAGELVYGVTYQVDIYEVSGYQPYKGEYRAGFETNKTFTLTEEIAEPLKVVSDTISACVPPGSPNDTEGAEWSITFNHPIELTTSYAGGVLEALDDGLAITSPDFDVDTTFNTLATDVLDNTQERGVSGIVTNDTLTITWDPSAGLATKDPQDPIDAVTYNGIGNIMVQRLNSPSSSQNLSNFVGATITCTP